MQPIGVNLGRSQRPRPRVPVVDPRSFVTPQHARDLLRDRLGTRTRVAEQPREDLSRLGHRDRRGFPPRLAVVPGTSTGAPPAVGPYDDTIPPSPRPRSGRAPPPPCRP